VSELAELAGLDIEQLGSLHPQRLRATFVMSILDRGVTLAGRPRRQPPLLPCHDAPL
jgi:hypothetical protein